MWRIRRGEIRTGQRFRRSGLNHFWQPFPTWEVEAVNLDSNGTMAATLRSLADETTRKTVAVAALNDPNMYESCR